MYQSGIDYRLAQILCAERLAEAARERAWNSACSAAPKSAARRWALALAAAAPVAVVIVWVLAGH